MKKLELRKKHFIRRIQIDLPKILIDEANTEHKYLRNVNHWSRFFDGNSYDIDGYARAVILDRGITEEEINKYALDGYIDVKRIYTEEFKEIGKDYYMRIIHFAEVKL